MSIEPMLWSPGMRLKRMPAGGLKPVAPPWLRSSVRSIHQSRSSGSTPNSCFSTPRDHSAAVCWYSGTPTRLPLRSSGFSMPLSARTQMPVWKKRREVKMGRPIQSRLPLAIAMSSDDSDISETSNS